jgi:hypothetical protein
VNRLVAALIAIGLIVVALVVRNGIDNGGGNSAGGKPRLVCAPELVSVCNKLSDVDVTIEDPGTTADKLEKADNDLGIDGWLAPGPWSEMVVEARTRNQKTPGLTVGQALGRSQIGLAVWPDRLAALAHACPPATPAIPWKCIGEVAGKGDWKSVGGPTEWGTIKIGIPDPVSSATGLAALGAATVGYFGKDPATLSSTDLDDPGFGGWLRGLATAAKGVPPLEQTLAAGASVGDAVATLEAIGTQLVRASAKKPTLTYPAPVASADVLLGTANTDNGRRLTGLIAPQQLIDASWEAPSKAPTGLPSAGFLDALRDAWKDAK